MFKKFSFKRTLALVLLLIIFLGILLYVWSSAILNKHYDLPMVTLNIPTDTASIREGERLTRIAHCSHCHGEHFNGGVVSRTPDVVEFVGPNITRILPSYSNGQLERLLRHGVKKNGASVYLMPCNMYYGLKDASVARIIAYLRTLKPIPSTPGIPASSIYYPYGRLQIIEGKFPSIAAELLRNPPGYFGNGDTTSVSLGKYLVMTSCSSCHAQDLKGTPGFSPNLLIAARYSRDQFQHLLKTGEGGLGRKKLGMMSDVATANLCYLHTAEINAIYDYLCTKPTLKY